MHTTFSLPNLADYRLIVTNVILGFVLLEGCSNPNEGRMMEDDILGTLTWTESTDAWEASVVVAPNTTVGISLIPLEEDIQPMIRRARLFVKAFAEHDLRLRQAAADSLLCSRNEFWSDGVEITAEEFKDRMSIDGINFMDDGTAEAYYFDGGLFAGHLIVIPINEDGSFDEANIAG